MRKLGKKDLDVAIEVGMVTALISGEGRMDRLYEMVHEEMDMGGIVDTSYTITVWACEFIERHKDTDWEKAVMHEEGDELPKIYERLSEKHKEYGKYLCCWDEAAEDFAEWKLENFDADEFSKINFNKDAVNPLLKV